MEMRNYINNYFMFMWNHWDYKTCIEIFGENLGEHIWSKWLNICNEYGPTGGVAILWGRIDSECQQKLTIKANKYYENIEF